MEQLQISFPIWETIFIVIGLFLLFISFFTVNQQSAGLIERFGKFIRIAHPGLNFKIPFIESISGMVSLRLMQLDVEVETKTIDDVFVTIVASVQYRILPDKVYEAFYTLDNAEAQIQAFVFDVVRARVPSIKLDDVFSKKDEIADTVCSELKGVMNEFGYDIIKSLVTDISPDTKVKAAMNEINEAQRLRVAANERGEAEKILKIKQAEADAESKILQGKGISGQRQAIIEGLRDSITHFQKEVQDSNTQDVLALIMMVQYFDTLKEIGAHSKTNTIMMPHSPQAMHDLYQQISNAVLTGQQVNDHINKDEKIW
ncbi:MAG: SPFH domain-containing protein [Alphaproteobacteria bacterium]|jgi:regulator of protease activity HflC (stomatin/prohibitin superfamily)|nr:SPFH domain-containing protein [Alphaproteobacteria bacterium]MBP9877575.1 SPFH domain-containing protein [Alphaproteobacteria bacterium]